MLDGILERLATYKEKILAIKAKIKSALFYPVSVIIVAFVVIWVIMIWVIPAFKQVFTSFGANLPAPTLIVMAVSDFFVSYWWAIAGIVGGAIFGFFFMLRRSQTFRYAVDRISLKHRGDAGAPPIPVGGPANDLIAIAVGVVAYLALAFAFHPVVIGVPVVGA